MLNTISNLFTKSNNLDFNQLNLVETTKHVHKLHPNKGKFIPQLAEYYLIKHFKKGDLILDPFLGSGTTVVQCKELGINTIGIDISSFHTLLTKSKITGYNSKLLENESRKLVKVLESKKKKQLYLFETTLKKKIRLYNSKYCTGKNVTLSPEDKKKIIKNFQKIQNRLLKKYKIKLNSNGESKYIHYWFNHSTLNELRLIKTEIEKIKNSDTKDLFKIVLSRTARSTRSAKHQSVASPRHPVLTPYFCKKHNKICSPPYTAFNKFTIYLTDSIKRVNSFNHLNTPSIHTLVTTDARTINYKKILKGKLLDGVFTSPPYVGQINYHKQHQYAYDLLGLKSNIEFEIGPLSRGRGAGARKRYITEISLALINFKPFLKPNAKVFLVANDRFNIYPQIFTQANYKILKTDYRNVSRRSEGDQSSYTETIFQITPIN